ncbi:elongation factor P [Streptomyces lasalocidi]
MVRRRVPARQARQGPGLRAHQAEERAVRQGRRQDLQQPSVKVETATVDKRDMQFSYMDGEYFVFMDMQTYDQLMIDRKAVGDAANFLIEGFEATVATHEGEVLFVELPAAVELVIEHTEPGVQGDRSTGGSKPAKLETGYEIQVPLFITTGEKIKVDTRTGDYLGRVNS